MGRQTYYYGGTPIQLTGLDIAQIAYQAGFRGTDLQKAVAISKRESGWKPNIHGTDSDPSRVSGDRGLFQINRVNDKTLVQAGILSREGDPAIFDPVVNARAAFLLYQRAGNSFSPAWSVGPGGWNGTGDPLYGTNLAQAVEFVTQAVNKGLLGIPWRSRGLESGSGGDGGGIFSDIPIIGELGERVGEVARGPLGAITSVGDAVVAIVSKLIDPGFWIRVLQVVGGVIMIIIGLGVLVGPEAASLTPQGQMAGL